MNEQQSITLQNQQQKLSTRKEEMAAIDKRIEELTDQLRQKRSLQNSHQAPPLIPNNNNNNMTNGSIPDPRPSSTSVTGTNGVTSGSIRQAQDAPTRSIPNGDIKHQVGQKKQGPPAPPKPQLMLKPQGFKLKGANKGSVSAPQGGPVTAQHPEQDAKQPEHDTVIPSKPELANENSGSDTSSLTENSSVDSVPVSGLPPQPLPPAPVKPAVKNGLDNKPISSKQRSSPVQMQRGSPVPTQRGSSPVHSGSQRSSPVQRESPVPQQRGSPVPQQRGSPIPQQQRGSPTQQQQRGSPIQQQQRGSPIPQQQQRGSPVLQQQQRGSPVPQQRGSPVPANRGSPVQRGSPVSQNQPSNKVAPRMLSLDSGTSSLQNRQARNRTPIYNPDDLAMLSPPAPPSPNGSSSSGSHVDFDDSIKSGHSFNGNVAPKGQLANYSGPGSSGTWNGRDASQRGLGGQNQHPSSPQRKRQPPPAPPRTSTLNYNLSHPSSPTRSRMASTDSISSTANGNMPPSTHPGSPQLSHVQRGPPGSPQRGPPGSPSRNGSYPNQGYGPNGSYSTGPSNNIPPRPQLPNDYPVTDPTRPIHQRSPATVGMYAPPPNAQQRNYNRPSYEQHANNGGQRYSGKPVTIPSHNLFHIHSASGPQYPTDQEDSPRPSSPTSKLPIMNLYRNIDLDRFRNMPRPLKKRLSYSEDKESLNFLRPEQRDGIPFFHSDPSADKKFDTLTVDPTVKPSENSSHSGNGNPPQLMETSLIGNSPQSSGKSVLSPDISMNTKPVIANQSKPVIANQSNDKTNGTAAKKNQYNLTAHGQLSKPSGSGKPLSASDIGEVKGILKRKPNGRESIRVRFDPLALLLDASLEGEFELVQRIIPEVRLMLIAMGTDQGN